MEGTREEIFGQIDQWIDGIDEPNILWLCGDPGAGKSAIAPSPVSKLRDRRRLGSSFFFRRGDIHLNDPSAVWRTVAFDLAQSNPIYAKNLAEVLKERRVDPERPDLASHFKLLIKEPLEKSHVHSAPHNIPVVLIDALDECDSDRSQAPQRQAFLRTLTSWSYLQKKFKLIITGRDDRVSKSFRTSCRQIRLPTGYDMMSMPTQTKISVISSRAGLQT